MYVLCCVGGLDTLGSQRLPATYRSSSESGAVRVRDPACCCCTEGERASPCCCCFGRERSAKARHHATLCMPCVLLNQVVQQAVSEYASKSSSSASFVVVSYGVIWYEVQQIHAPRGYLLLCTLFVSYVHGYIILRSIIYTTSSSSPFSIVLVSSHSIFQPRWTMLRAEEDNFLENQRRLNHHRTTAQLTNYHIVHNNIIIVRNNPFCMMP